MSGHLLNVLLFIIQDMNNDKDVEEAYKYLQEQEVSWRDLGYNAFLSKKQQLIQAGMLSPYALSYLEPGGLNGNQMVDIAGDHIVANTLDAKTITTSTLDAAVDVGNGGAGAFVRIDGPNNRIVIHDGTTNRIVIGNV
jgi:hypothetical protein